MEIAKTFNEGVNIEIALQVIYFKDMSMHLCRSIAKRMLKIYILH